MTNVLNSIYDRIKKVCNPITSFLRTKIKTINIIYSISIIVYFFLVFLPNITTGTPFASFFNQGATKIVYRIVIALAFGLISFMAFIANKVVVNRILLYVLLGFFFFLIIGTFFNLSSISATVYNGYYEKVVITSTTGFSDLLTYYGNLAFSYIFCFALFTCIPVVMKEKNRWLLLIDSFVIAMIILCLISYVKDFKLYIAALKFDYDQYGSKDISSLFPSKNAFGVFLLQGTMVSLIAHHFRQGFKYRFIYLIVSLLFSITIAFTMCKDAIFALALFAIILFSYFLTKRPKTKKDYFFIGLWVIMVALTIIVLILLIMQKNLVSNPFFKKLFNFLGANPVHGNDNALFGRLEIVAVFFLGISGIHYLVGYGHALPANAYIWSLTFRGEGNENLHNSFLHVFGTGGILYFFFYISLLAYVYFAIFKEKKNDKKIFFLLFGLLTSHTFYSLFETSIMFLSGSSATMLLSIVLITLIQFDTKKKDNSIRLSFCEVDI